MVYVLRDKDGKVCSLSEQKTTEQQESLEMDHPQVINFLLSCDHDKRLQFLQSDLQLIRVLEDLIDILINKNVITITDFPEPVIVKLMKRQSIRKLFSNASGMEFDDG